MIVIFSSRKPLLKTIEDCKFAFHEWKIVIQKGNEILSAFGVLLLILVPPVPVINEFMLKPLRPTPNYNKCE